VIKYIHVSDVFTLPEATTVQVGSRLSVQVAPRSTKDVQSAMFILDDPERMITGGVVSGVSIIVIFLCTWIARLPEESVAS
jgi:hypothetical protein